MKRSTFRLLVVPHSSVPVTLFSAQIIYNIYTKPEEKRSLCLSAVVVLLKEIKNVK